MPISPTHLATASDPVDRSAYTAGPFTPESNRLVLAAVTNTRGVATADTPTLSGNGLTWVQIATVLYDSVASPKWRLTLFRAMGSSPTQGAVTIDFAGSVQTGCQWSFVEFANVDIGGTDGSAAIVQSATAASVTDRDATFASLAAFSDSGNGAFGGFAHVTAEASAPGAGFTEIGDSILTGPPNAALETEWRVDPDTSVDASWATAARCAGIAVEIKTVLIHTLKLVKDGVNLIVVNTETQGAVSGDAWDPLQLVEDQIQVERGTLLDAGSHRGYE